MGSIKMSNGFLYCVTFFPVYECLQQLNGFADYTRYTTRREFLIWGENKCLFM